MMKTKKGLIQFLKENCSHYDSHYAVCANGGECAVLAGQRCGYFEKVVLGPSDYPYRLPGWDYGKLFAQYAQQTGAATKRIKQRLCVCGSPLQPRQRYCSKCRDQKRRETYRNSKRSSRLAVHS